MGTMGDDSATVPAVGRRKERRRGGVRHHQTGKEREEVWSTLYECGNAFLVLEGLRLFDQVDLVLEDDEVLELHDLHGRQVLRRLRLWACFVRGDEEKRGIHDRRAV
jgi:hypothetical protein